MNANKVLADFQFLGNRVSKLIIDTKLLDHKGSVEVTYDFDYKMNGFEEQETRYIGILSFIIKVKATIKKKMLFKVELEMEGVFVGDTEKLKPEKFMEMLEMNGLITLLQISRAYILSVTSQSGINPPVKIPMINVVKLRDEKKFSEATEKSNEEIKR